MSNYYDKNYFTWQKKAGLCGGMQDIWKFQKYIKNTDVVLDFGCGGGYILGKINCKKRVGVEVNKTAQKIAQKKGITVFDSLQKLPRSLKFDIIISHHTLEHVDNPAGALKELKKYLKPKGRTIHVIPVDDYRQQPKYYSHDINQHLFTWTPLLIGNLFSHCGYTIKKVQLIPYLWLPLSVYYYTFIPKPIYYFLTKMWGTFLGIREIHIVATH